MNNLKIVFLSNYFNHHQKYLADEFFDILKNDFHFIETIPMEQERKNMGWLKLDAPYVVRTHESVDRYELAMRLISDADVVIAGSAAEHFLKDRIKANKCIFRYAERPFKGKHKLLRFPILTLKYNLRNPRGKAIYLLCASAYTANDFGKMMLFNNKTFKWGYFPKVNTYEVNRLYDSKHPYELLWCGRIINWKHLEHAIMAVKQVVDQGYDITLNIVGDGPLRGKMFNLVSSLGLINRIKFVGSIKSDEVRTYMEKASILLFTSDFDEGWGAVLNEAMNSACAVIASHAAGSVPFLIKNNENGIIYEYGDIVSIADNIIKLIIDNEFREKISKNAYYSIVDVWSPKVAAKRFIELYENINATNELPFVDGPCSTSQKLKNNWFKKKR